MLQQQEKIINLTGQSFDENKNRLATFSAVIYSDSNHYSITQSVDAVNDAQKKNRWIPILKNLKRVLKLY